MSERWRNELRKIDDLGPTTDLLERASELPLPRLDAPRRGSRIAVTLVALVIPLLLVFGAVAILSQRGGDGGGISNGGLPAATESPLEATPGEYYYSKIWLHAAEECTEIGCTYTTEEIETWWSPDESGRIVTAKTEKVYEPGTFPHDTITTDLPTDPATLKDAMYARSGPDGASPEPQTTVSPGQDGMDASVQQSIVNLLEMPNVTPALRAALLEILAASPGVDIELGTQDPVGRPAVKLTVKTFGGPTIHELFVDPATHELLAHIEEATNGPMEGTPWREMILQSAGVAPSVDEVPSESPVAAPESLPDTSSDPTPEEQFAERCSQGGPDLQLTIGPDGYSKNCFIIETGAPFSLTVTVTEPGVDAQIVIEERGGKRLFEGEAVVGTGSVTYEIPALPHGRYDVINIAHPKNYVGPLQAA